MDLLQRGGGGHKFSKNLEAPQDIRRQTREINKVSTMHPEILGANVTNLVAAGICTPLYYVMFQMNFIL